MNESILNILKRKVLTGEVKVEDIKSVEYREAIEDWLANR